MKKERIAQIDRTATKFTTEAAARRYAERCLKLRSIVLGDDGKLWITTPADAAGLEKAGYTVIEYFLGGK